nr:HAD domain-containing protein [Actinopolymorpha pittospori]
MLFLDVDGTLIPFGVPPAPRPDVPELHETQDPSDAPINPFLARLDPEHGRRLLALPCDLVWASSWMSDANEEIAPRIGLPELPVVAWPDGCEGEEGEGLHWKTRALVDCAAGRAFVWVDDEITETDRSWVSEHHQGLALLHRVKSSHGLTDADFAIVGDWLARC